jgi:hypothetical protein
LLFHSGSDPDEAVLYLLKRGITETQRFAQFPQFLSHPIIVIHFFSFPKALNGKYYNQFLKREKDFVWMQDAGFWILEVLFYKIMEKL